MSKIADLLSQGDDMRSVLQAATHIEQFRYSLLPDLPKFSETLSASPEGNVVESNGQTVAVNLNTAIKKLARVEEDLTNAWLDHYARIRPGPPIVRRDAAAGTMEWRSVEDLRITLQGPARNEDLSLS